MSMLLDIDVPNMALLGQRKYSEGSKYHNELRSRAMNGGKCNTEMLSFELSIRMKLRFYKPIINQGLNNLMSQTASNYWG